MAANPLKYVKGVLKFVIDRRGFDQVLEKLQIVSAGQGKCVAEMMVEKQHTNRGNTLHGGMTDALVDGVSTLALMSHEKGTPGISIGIQVQYLGAAKVGDKLVIDAETKKMGKSLAFMDVQITNTSTGSLIALGSHTMLVGENFGDFKYEK
ncbi:acyl-coenzyme A thioesterase 13-like [Neocloeon triangulifer]|uniref:acyl-coenzyme A thioesterase 13-like n=1 Tax=Neocloeon triangulifer TaxID=2078957 RepID=UPI00286EB6C2|nr:acyl-coenzyme A thioesterase 13-like [Neocloeon triangulifer]